MFLMNILQMIMHLFDIFIPGKDEVHEHMEHIFREAFIDIIVKIIFA